MKKEKFVNNLLEFIKKSPTPFHAVSNMEEILSKAGFIKLEESDTWDLKKEKGYWVTRNDSSLIAFYLGKNKAPMSMTGAHTDSPCLKIKPRPEITNNSYIRLGVEIYGGALLNPWFDRDLSMAGRVSFLGKNKKIMSKIINFNRPVAVIPSLAIHFDREANRKKSINPQEDMPPILFVGNDDKKFDFKNLLKEQVEKEYHGIIADCILDFEISLYDCQPPAFTGLDKNFITGSRLDNLISCFAGVMGITQKNKNRSCLLVCNDHEEVGSKSAPGADGPFLGSVLKRIYPGPQEMARAISASMMISADGAHGIHPNFPAKSDKNHAPVLNRGIAIKINANHRYASNSETSAIFRYLCMGLNIPVQEFVMRSDMACGSTIGPITSGKIGIKTVDVGVPMLAMHSVREMAGADDVFYLYKALQKYFKGSFLSNL